MGKMFTTAIKRNSIKVKALACFTAIIAAVALPQIVHGLGVLSGTGPALGQALLPMHIPVILAGLMFGSLPGAIAGVISPLISYLITGMPAASLLPFMVIELAAYGVAAGMLAKVKMPSVAKVVIIQLTGRAIRAAAVAAGVLAFGNTAVGLGTIKAIFVSGLLGIALQWLIVPLILYRFNELAGKNE